MQDIHRILKQYWGFDSFRPGQEAIIRSVMEGKDTLALLPTGGGKSVCFQVPALAKEGLCLVISPLIALMKDQVYQLNKKGIKALAVYTGMPARQMDTVLDNCVYGDYKFLYISPERLATEDFRVRMSRMKISLLAVDEAHCISQWGYDFRPSYLKIVEVREKLKGVPVIALTATATPDIADDIQDRLQFKKKNEFVKSFVRSNLSYVVRRVETNKKDALLDILQKVKGTAIVYTRSRRRSKEFSDYLNKHKIKSDFYHAGLEPNERSRKQDNWIKDKTRVICCTNAFGMGIDKPDVRLVIHGDVPDTIEAYFQEAGRAGRDEKKSYAVLLIEDSDLSDLEMKIKQGYPGIEFIKEVYEALGSYFRIAYDSGMNQPFDFDIVDFTTRFSFPTALVLASLKILEQQEILYTTESVFNASQVKCIAGKDAIYKFQVEHKKLEPMVKFILRSSPGVFEDYVPIEEEAVASRMKLNVEEVMTQLKTLDRYGIFRYQPRKNKPQLIFLTGRMKKEDLRLDRAFVKKRKALHDEKLRAMEKYITHTRTCRTVQLVSYFGEKDATDCGVCDVCLSKKKKAGQPSVSITHIAASIETELKSAPLTPTALRHALGMGADELAPALDYLTDQSKIFRNEKGEIEWVASRT